jgi:hypothetical protein
MNTEIQDKFKNYLEIQRELVEARKKQTEQKKQLKALEDEIMNYMNANEMDSIVLKEGEIILYDRKVSQTFKKETIAEKLSEKLKCDEQKAEELTESIFSNKVFKLEKKIKANIKRSKKQL